MIKISNKQEEIYIQKKPNENINNQKIEQDYNSIRRLIKDQNKKPSENIPKKITTSKNKNL